MALRELLLPWDAQPQDAVALRPDIAVPGALVFNGFTRGFIDASSTISGTVLAEAGPGGIAAVANTASSCVRTVSRETSFVPGQATFVAQFVLTGTTSCRVWSVGGTGSGDPIDRFALNNNAGGSALSRGIGVRYRDNSSNDRTSSTSTNVITLDELTTVVVTIDSASSASFYVNGKSVATSANIGTGAYSGGVLQPRTTPFLANDTGSGVTDGSSVLKLYLAAKLPLAHPDPLGLSADPWRYLVEPRRIIVPVSAGGGGITVALSGLSATFAQTAPAVSSTVSLVGENAAASAGMVLPAFSFALLGQAGVASAGTLSPSTSRTLSGQSAAFSAGSVIPSVAIAAIGLQATFAPGTLTASSSAGSTVALTGESATFAQTAPSTSVTIALTGIAATMAAGILSSSSGTATITVKAGSWLRYKKLQ